MSTREEDIRTDIEASELCLEHAFHNATLTAQRYDNPEDPIALALIGIGHALNANTLAQLPYDFNPNPQP